MVGFDFDGTNVSKNIHVKSSCNFMYILAKDS